MGNKTGSSILIPNDIEFLSNKDISDRVYTWALINGENIGGEIYIDKKPRAAYKELGINYRTFYKKIDKLKEHGYLVEEEFKYKIVKPSGKFFRYIYKDIAQKLLETKIDNIIKIYVYLGTLYGEYRAGAYFTYNKLIETIGYSNNKNTSNKNNILKILEKLKELGLIKYGRADVKKTNIYNKFHIYKVV